MVCFAHLASTLLIQKAEVRLQTSFSPEIELWADWLRTHTEIGATTTWTEATWTTEGSTGFTLSGFLSPARDRLLTLDGRIVAHDRSHPSPELLVPYTSFYRIDPVSEATTAILLAQGRRSEAIRIAELNAQAHPNRRDIGLAIQSHLDHRYAEVLTRYEAAQDIGALKSAKHLAYDITSLTEIVRRLARQESAPIVFDPLPELAKLTAELQRRVQMRRPSSANRLAQASVSDLIRRLEDLSGGTRTGVRGRVRFVTNPVVLELAARGNQAVPALLNALERDQRLTRQVVLDRRRTRPSVPPVTYPVLDVLNLIVGVRELPGIPDWSNGPHVASVYRSFFESTKGQTRVQRTVAVLDGQAEPWQWVEAAKNLIRSNVSSKNPRIDDERFGLRRLADQLSNTERTAVVALLDRRIDEISLKSSAGAPTAAMAELETARALLLPKGALVRLKRTMDRSMEEPSRTNAEMFFSGSIARAFRIRILLRDPQAVAEYDVWLKLISTRAEHQRLDVQWLAPLRELDQNAALIPTAEWVLNAHNSPYLRDGYRKLAEWPTRSYPPLGRVPRLIRSAFLRELAGEVPVGTVTRTSGSGLRIELLNLPGWSEGGDLLGVELKPGESQTIRRSDLLLMALRWNSEQVVPFSIGWPKPRRDAVIRAVADRLKLER